MRTTHLIADGETSTHCEMSWADVNHGMNLYTDGADVDAIPDADCEACLRDLIQATQHGHPDTLTGRLHDAAAVQLAELTRE